MLLCSYDTLPDMSEYTTNSVGVMERGGNFARALGAEVLDYAIDLLTRTTVAVDMIQQNRATRTDERLEGLIGGGWPGGNEPLADQQYGFMREQLAEKR